MNNENERISEIQNRLRLISRVEKTVPLIISDGIYGDETAQAVTEFQRIYALEQTGKVDYDTWVKIENVYNGALFKVAPADSPAFFPYPAYVTYRGEVNDVIYIIQYMLRELNCAYDDAFADVKLTGIYDGATADAITEFQRINGLPQTGLTDKLTWNALVKSHDAFCKNRSYIG